MRKLYLSSILCLVILGIASYCLAANPGDIVINEAIQNPAAVPDANGEWFELYNATDSDIDIDGWIIRDDGSDSHTINNGGPLWVPADSFIVLGRDSNSTTNGGYHCDYQYSGFTLANGDDEIYLIEGSTVIDSILYDGGPLWPDPNGKSMELKDPSLDNNVGANWQEAYTQYGDGDYGTPGRTNSVPPVNIPPDISGVFHTPKASTSSDPVIVRATITDTDGSIVDDSLYYQVTSKAFTAIYHDSIGTGPDTIYYYYTIPSQTDWALVEYYLMAKDDYGDRTASDTTSYTVQVPGDIADPGDVVVNEIMQNPGEVDDTQGEYVELFNTTDSPIDINMWVLADVDYDSHTIANNGPLYIPAGWFVVLARDSSSSTNGGFDADYQYSGFSLSNSSDEVVLWDVAGNTIDSVAYDNGTTFPDPDSASMELKNPGYDNSVGSNWRTAVDPFGLGDKGTPGDTNSVYEVGVRLTDLSAVPASFSLSQNYPNPFNPVTQIAFSLPERAEVRLSVYNIAGQQVAELVDEKLDAGSYQVNWDGRSFTSGVYFYRMEAGNHQMTKKMVLLK